MPHAFLTLYTYIMEYFVAFLMGLGWELRASLPRMLLVAGIRWLLAKLLGFERKPRMCALFTGLVSPYLFPALILLYTLLEDAFGLPGMTRLLPILLSGGLTLFWEHRFSRRHITHPDPNRFRTYYAYAVGLTIAALMVFSLLY